MLVRYATGMGEKVPKQVWRYAVFDSKELHRLGWQVVANTPVTDLTSASGEVPILSPTIPERLMSFLCHFSEARWWSYAWMRFALPDGFAAVLAEGPQAVDHLQFWRTLWDAATFAESVHGAGHPSATGVCELREAIYWLDWPSVQRLLDRGPASLDRGPASLDRGPQQGSHEPVVVQGHTGDSMHTHIQA